VKLYDTAGLRETDELVEREGIRRAENMVAEADLVLYLHDLSVGDAVSTPADPRVLTVGTKADLAPARNELDLSISVQTGAGLQELRSMIGRRIEQMVRPDSFSLPSRLRHKDSLAECLSAIERSLRMDGPVDLDLRAEELRIAANALGRITGRVDVENLLDVIFSEFCIGK
jgi:tRNA modification GTPase